MFILEFRKPTMDDYDYLRVAVGVWVKKSTSLLEKDK